MNSILKQVQRALNQRRNSQFLFALNPSQQADVGISPGDLQSSVFGPSDTRERMEAMAAAHGLEPDALNREHWREVDIARACTHCGERRVCTKWLSGRRQDLAAGDFCPNAAQFAELAKAPDPDRPA